MDVESLACPVSVIEPQSIASVNRFYEARRTQKLGGVLYGADSSLWPARWYDAVNLFQHEMECEEAAASRAMHAYCQSQQR